MTVYINEYAALGSTSQFGPQQIPLEPALAKYSFTNGASSANAGVTFNAKTNLIRIHNDSASAICLAIGPGLQTAVTGVDRLAPNATEFRAVPQGGQYSIAAINTT